MLINEYSTQDNFPSTTYVKLIEMSKEKVVDELHKAARKNYNRRSVILKGIDDLWQADLIDFKNLSKDNDGYKYILVVIDCLSKYAWVVPIKRKTKGDVTDAFERIMRQSNRKPSNLQTDMGTEFYNDLFKKSMKQNNINHYSSFSIKKASIAERLIKTLKNNLYKYFNTHGSYKWKDLPLKEVVRKYNNTVHSTTKYKPVYVNTINQNKVLCNIIASQKQTYKKRKIKFKVGDCVRISKYKGCFKKGYTPNWSTELFTINKVKETDPVTYHIQDQNNQPILGSFYQEELQKTNYPNIYLIEKVLKKKGNKLFVKWLGLDNNENSWIHKKSIVS